MPAGFELSILRLRADCPTTVLPKQYGKVAYLELLSHQISEPKQQAKRENLHLAKISEMLAN